MADTITHRAIAEDVIKILKSHLPDEDYEYFKLGNWLTDVSQFRDPPAFLNAKGVILDQTRTSGIFGPTELALAQVGLNLDQYLDLLFGKLYGAGKLQFGFLAQFCQELVFVSTCNKFKKNIPVEDIVRLYYGKSLPPSCGSYGTGYWTQYFPHEHLDFPPWLEPQDQEQSRLPVHQCNGGVPPGKRKTLAYLDEQILYLSLLLSRVEHEWPRSDVSVDDKHETLARYAHASHAVEDFFFHSNFVELAWSLSHDRALPGDASTHNRRIFFRRQLTPSDSDNGVDCRLLFTGSFGHDDVFHTLMDAISVMLQEQQSNTPSDSPAVALKKTEEKAVLALILNAIMPWKTVGGGDDVTQADKKTREAVQADKLRKHRERFRNGQYRQMASLMPRMERRAIECALIIDNQMATTFSRIMPGLPLGVVGMLQKLALEAQEVEDESKKVAEFLDQAKIVEDRRVREKETLTSVDGKQMQLEATAETIGTHTLLAKDSVNKEPLRAQTVRLATVVACQVALTMASRVKAAVDNQKNNVPPDVEKAGVDWLHLLQHFLSHPSESEGPGHGWWEKVLADEGAKISLDVPESSFHLKLISAEEVKRRLAEEPNLRKRLEKHYNGLAYLAEWKFQKLKNLTGGLMVR